MRGKIKIKLIKGEIDGKKETRIFRDCDREIEYQGRAFSLKLNILDKVKFEGSTEKKAISEVENALQILQLQSRELCKRWNAFLVVREEYDRKAEWIRKVFSSFTMLLNNVKLIELEDPSLKREFLQKLLKWFEDTARENEEIKGRWEEIKEELKELEEELRKEEQLEKEEQLKKEEQLEKEAREMAKAGVEKAIENLIEKEYVLSPSVPPEEFKKQLELKDIELAQEECEKALKSFELGVKGLEGGGYEEAIKEFEEALKSLPEDLKARASVLWNLGIALIEWPLGNRSENLNRAIESYKKVLAIYTNEKSPERFAGAQNNLGAAYANLPTGDRAANLNEAINAYEEALKVRTLDRFPWEYAETSANLAVAYAMKGDTSKAREIMEEVVPLSKILGHPRYEKYEAYRGLLARLGEGP